MLTSQYSHTRLFDLVDDLVDDRSGVIRFVREVPITAGAPKFFHFVARACNSSAFGPEENFSLAGGASADRGIALAKSVGEAVERYCAALYDRKNLPLTSAKLGNFHCVEPEKFALYSPSQYSQANFPFAPFNKNTWLRWTRMESLASRKSYYVPASMVYLPYSASEKEEGESRICQTMSTGLACHCSLTEATISAACEVIERDAFTLTWQARMPMPRIRIETLSEHNQDLVDRFTTTGQSVALFSLVTDHQIPVVLGILLGDKLGQPAFVFSASANLSPEQAVRKSLEELAHTRRLAVQLMRKHPSFIPTPNYDNVVTQDAHVRLFCDRRSKPLVDFLFTRDEWIAFSDITDLSSPSCDEDLRCIVNRISAIGYDLLVADLTSEDIQPLGLSVVRVLIPGFHPLFMGHQLRALGGSRLWSLPQKLRRSGLPLEKHDNSAPHPFP